MSTDRTTQDERDQARESAAAIAALERRAAEFGVRPFDADEWSAEQTDQDPDDAKQEVDALLGLLRGAAVLSGREEGRIRLAPH